MKIVGVLIASLLGLLLYPFVEIAYNWGWTPRDRLGWPHEWIIDRPYRNTVRLICQRMQGNWK